MDTDQIYHYVGLFGAGLYLLSYSLLQFRVIGGHSLAYSLMNLGAASCVAISLISSFNAASFIVQSSWICLSIYGLIRMFVHDRRIRFDKDENAFLRNKLPGLSKKMARDVLNRGVWVSGDVGTVLTKQGEQNEHLIYILTGAAEVVLNGEVIAHAGKGSFIGEMTLHDGGPASATVRIVKPARYLCLDANALRKLCKREPQISQALDASFASDMRTKLHASNAATQAA